MTAFSILGASGHAFANGIVTYGLMASSSALVIPLSLLRRSARGCGRSGKRHGFMTPVQMFRDRWECGHIGTVIFAVQAVLLVPYIIIAVMGGGTTLRDGQQRARAVLARRRDRLAGRDGLRVLRRHARHRLGQRVPDGAVPAVRRHRRRRWSAPAWAASGTAMESMLALAVDGAAADARAGLAAVLSQLHVHPAVVDRLSAHRHLLPDGAPPRALPEDRSSSTRSACSRSGCRRSFSASSPTRRPTCPPSRRSSRRGRRWPPRARRCRPSERDRLRARPPATM